MITKSEVDGLKDRVSKLEKLTKQLCKQLELQNNMIRNITRQLNRVKYAEYNSVPKSK